MRGEPKRLKTTIWGLAKLQNMFCMILILVYQTIIWSIEAKIQQTKIAVTKI